MPAMAGKVGDRLTPAGWRLFGELLQPQPFGNLGGEVIVDIAQVSANHLARMPGLFDTLLSSNTKASAMWACSIAVWLM